MSKPGLAETEQMKLRAWKTRAKGHPTRWRMLRDAVAVLSLEWMTTSQFQVAMRRIWALKNTTSRDMLEELEGGRSVKQERDEKAQVFKWGATRDGVKFWIVSVDRIPAGVVQVAQSTASVNELEVK
jgi:hypothetical protein